MKKTIITSLLLFFPALAFSQDWGHGYPSSGGYSYQQAQNLRTQVQRLERKLRVLERRISQLEDYDADPEAPSTTIRFAAYKKKSCKTSSLLVNDIQLTEDQHYNTGICSELKQASSSVKSVMIEGHCTNIKQIKLGDACGVISTGKLDSLVSLYHLKLSDYIVGSDGIKPNEVLAEITLKADDSLEDKCDEFARKVESKNEWIYALSVNGVVIEDSSFTSFESSDRFFPITSDIRKFVSEICINTGNGKYSKK